MLNNVVTLKVTRNNTSYINKLYAVYLKFDKKSSKTAKIKMFINYKHET